MNSDEVLRNGEFIWKSEYSSMRVYRYLGKLWATFNGNRDFAYCWGQAPKGKFVPRDHGCL